MKHNLLYIRYIFVIGFLLFCFQNEVLSQNNDSIKRIDTIKKYETIKRKKPGLFIGISAGPSQTDIKSVGTHSISQVTSSIQNSYAGSFEIGYFFSRYFGLSSGVNYVSYKSQLTLDSYQNSFNTVDSEGDAFEMRVTGSGIKEIQTVDFLSIPLCINLRLPFSKTVGLFFKGGVSMSFPMNQKYTSSGTFTYKGFYAQYNDLLENLPAYGFPTNKNVVGAGQLKLKSVGVSPCISAGLDFYVKKKIQIAIGVSYNNISLGNNEGSTSTDTFHLSPDATHINSFVGGSNKTTAQSMGLDFSVKFYL